MCWGGGSSGKLGNGSSTSTALPVQVIGLESGVVDVQAGQSHTCALTADGIMKCWGGNFSGQLGTGDKTSSLVPVPVPSLGSNVASIAVGYNHSCAVTRAGAAYCWGFNMYGQLGNGSTSTTGILNPGVVIGLSSGVSSIATGGEHTCAKMTDATLRCWGNNSTGAVGDGSWTTRTSPVNVSGFSAAVTSVAAGRYHTCATDASGKAYCWGNGGPGSLGNGSTQHRRTPTLVSGITTGATAIDGGINHSCAIVNAAAQCWGYNNYGQVGDGTVTNKLTPVAVASLDGPVLSVAAGDHFSCALVEGGKVYCWGANDQGTLGDGTTGQSSVPVQVVKE